jgi:putative tricarboxylic transport membrane protein
MADRLFAGALLIVALGYTWLAFTVISAPIQYDPLGPESWPRIIGTTAALCLLVVLGTPSVSSLSVERRSLTRLAATVALLFGYAFLYQPIGFVPATWIFCGAITLMLGARPLAAAAFGGGVALVAFFGATRLLDLNLPAGPVIDFLRS